MINGSHALTELSRWKLAACWAKLWSLIADLESRFLAKVQSKPALLTDRVTFVCSIFPKILSRQPKTCRKKRPAMARSSSKSYTFQKLRNVRGSCRQLATEAIMSESLQGKFLIASPNLRDPGFFRTVVLMLEHDAQNAMGLIINRPSSITIEAAMAELKQPSPTTDPIYTGGPVDTSALFILHSAGGELHQDSEVAAGIYLTGSNESFEALLNNPTSTEQPCLFRIYCGYAGWGPGQLESEIGRGDWRILPADSELVFGHDAYEVWEVCTQQIKMQNRLLPHDAKNPEWN